MDSPVSSISYLSRAKSLRDSEDKAQLIYAALELRCGVEAKLKEIATAAPNISKNKSKQWEIPKLSKTIDGAFNLGDSFQIIHLKMENGTECSFLYAPVNKRLQEIAMKCGDYLHAIPNRRIQDIEFWSKLRKMLEEGCSLLELACNSEILCPSMEQGLHFSLSPDDPRITVIKDYQSGVKGSFSTVTITPTASGTFYSPTIKPE